MWIWIDRRLKVLEAATLLLLARYLIRFVAMRRWRGSLGQPCDLPPAATAAVPSRHTGPLPGTERIVRQAIDRACRRLPGETVCLPRAMAAQWMLRRRGKHPGLVFGIRPDDSREKVRHGFHAWVECDGRVVIGEIDHPGYRRSLVLR
jgi:hypothetical protein